MNAPTTIEINTAKTNNNLPTATKGPGGQWDYFRGRTPDGGSTVFGRDEYLTSPRSAGSPAKVRRVGYEEFMIMIRPDLEIYRVLLAHVGPETRREALIDIAVPLFDEDR